MLIKQTYCLEKISHSSINIQYGKYFFFTNILYLRKILNQKACDQNRFHSEFIYNSFIFMIKN